MSRENDRSNLGIVRDPEIKVKVGESFSRVKVLGSHWDRKKLLSITEIKDLWKEIHGPQSLKEMETTERRKVYLHELLTDSDILLPKLEVPERPLELERRIAALKNSLAEKEYQRMTQNVTCTSQHRPQDSIGFQVKQMNSTLIAVFQFLVSIACAFFFGFKGIEVFSGSLELPIRLLLGITIALIVGAADLYFLVMNTAAEDELLYRVPTSHVTSSSLKENISNSVHFKTS